MKHLFVNARDSSKKILALLLVLTLLFTFALPALAGDSEPVTATTALNVRSGPGTNYRVISYLKTGQTVPRVGKSGNWSKILLNGVECYAFSKYLTVGSGSGSGDGGSGSGGSSLGNVQAIGNVNVRTGPGTKYRKVGALKKSDLVTRVGTSGSWTIINWNNGTAFVSSRYLNTVNTGVPAPEESYYVTQNTTMRSGRGANYSAVAYLLYGDVVTLTTQQSSGWAQVNHNGRNGYIQWSHLSKELSSAAYGIAYATSRQEVRSGAGSNYSILGYLQAGEGAERTGLSGSWTRIRYNARDGYVLTNTLTVLPGSAGSEFTNAEQWMYATVDRVYVYSIPNSNNDYRVGYLDRNERVLQTAYNNSWSRVYVGGRIGYVATSSLNRYDGGIGYKHDDPILIINPNGAKMFRDSKLTQPYIHRDVFGRFIADVIPYNTTVYFLDAIENRTFTIHWKEHNLGIYISMMDAK